METNRNQRVILDLFKEGLISIRETPSVGAQASNRNSMNRRMPNCSIHCDNLASAISMIPPTASEIHIEKQNNRDNSQHLVDHIGFLPNTVTSLSLKRYQLKAFIYSNNYFFNIISNIPTNIVELDFSSMRLSSECVIMANYFLTGIQYLKHSVKKLNLDDNCLYHLENKLETLLSHFTHLQSLSIGQNELDMIGWEIETHKDQLSRALESLPPSIKRLNLSGNDLDNKARKLNEIFSSIPERLNQLDLSDNKFGTGSVEPVCLAQALQSLSQTSLMTLYFNSNLLCLMDTTLKCIFEAFPSSLTELHLEDNSLGFTSKECLIDALSSLPLTRHTLNLRNNQLAELMTEDLSECLASMPSTLHTLNIRNNQLANLTTDGIIQCLSSIPISIQSIQIEDNEFETKKSAVEIDKILYSFHKKTFPTLQILCLSRIIQSHEQLQTIQLSNNPFSKLYRYLTDPGVSRRPIQPIVDLFNNKVSHYFVTMGVHRREVFSSDSATTFRVNNEPDQIVQSM